MDFLTSSYLGQWFFQSLLHSLIALLIVERAIGLWAAQSPLWRFRLRILTLALPVVMYPIFQSLNPERGSFFFRREEALFDGGLWLGLKIGEVPIGSLVFLLVISITSFVMLIQEILPIIRHVANKKSAFREGESVPSDAIREIIRGIIADKGLSEPEIQILVDEHPLIFTAGTKTIVLSTGFINSVTKDELKSALSHEIAHIIRRSTLTTFFIFLLRLLMFYNPISLLVFRHALQDDEMICDDLTVSMTKRPELLASVLKRFYSGEEATQRQEEATQRQEGVAQRQEGVAQRQEGVAQRQERVAERQERVAQRQERVAQRLVRMKESIESASHDIKLRERIERLESMPREGIEESSATVGIVLSTLSVAVVCYFVV